MSALPCKRSQETENRNQAKQDSEYFLRRYQTPETGKIVQNPKFMWAAAKNLLSEK